MINNRMDIKDFCSWPKVPG